MRAFALLLAATLGAVTLTTASAEELIRFPSLIGPSKYENGDARHYDYVNPDAPVGGRLNSTASGSFDSFNPFITRGTPAAGLNYTGGLLYDSLMEQSTQEPSVSVPLLALGMTHADDFSSATYRLNPKARWHDGKAISASDVKWTLQALRDNFPFYNRYFADVKEVVAVDPTTVRFEFAQTGNRELPHIMGDLPVLPEHWWTGTGPDGKPRDISAPTLEKPLGSGPYRIKAFRPGSSIVWERVEDYWGWETFPRVGRYNFAELRYTYFQNQDAEWQAFQKYGFEDFRVENRSQKWAQEYTFPAFRAGDVVKATYPQTSGYPMQAWVMNTRRAQFKDPRVREALSKAYDFESMNRNLFFGLYKRTDSYFGGTELQSKGRPEGRELEILNEVKATVPPEAIPALALEAPFEPTTYADRSATRANLREALTLLNEAGYASQGGKLVGPDGRQLAFQFLAFDPTSERTIGPFIANLKRLGIDATIRVVDTSQFIERLRNFDFDIVTTSWNQSQSPGNEQREYWSSVAAKKAGSRNLAGIENPAVDALIEKIVYAKDRDELVAATRALDRVLLHAHYVVPQWYNAETWVAYWNKFGIPKPQPSYVGVDTFSWWIDETKARALEAKYGGALMAPLDLTRRGFARLATGLVGASALTAFWPAGTSLAANPTGEKLHGLSPFGELKYPADYKHFDWVKPDAPKGGTFAFDPAYWFYNQNVQTFDTLNSFVLKGSAPPRMEYCFTRS